MDLVLIFVAIILYDVKKFSVLSNHHMMTSDCTLAHHGMSRQIMACHDMSCGVMLRHATSPLTLMRCPVSRSHTLTTPPSQPLIQMSTESATAVTG